MSERHEYTMVVFCLVEWFLFYFVLCFGFGLDWVRFLVGWLLFFYFGDFVCFGFFVVVLAWGGLVIFFFLFYFLDCHFIFKTLIQCAEC